MKEGPMKGVDCRSTVLFAASKTPLETPAVSIWFVFGSGKGYGSLRRGLPTPSFGSSIAPFLFVNLELVGSARFRFGLASET